MPVLFHDKEWRSQLDVTKHGISRVARHESTFDMMTAYAIDDGPVMQWCPALGEDMPGDLHAALTSPDVVKVAWSKPAEWCMWMHRHGIETPHSSWHDGMVMALALSMPGALSDVCDILKINRSAGFFRKRDLIRQFCVINEDGSFEDPRKSASDFAEMREFNRDDVSCLREAYNRLSKFDFGPKFWHEFSVDQVINEMGIPIDRALAENGRDVSQNLISDSENMLRRIMSVRDVRPTKVLAWLRDYGYSGDLRKASIERGISEFSQKQGFSHVVKVLKIRKIISSSSIFKKYGAICDRLDDDGRLRYALQFCGAGRTGRWSGRGAQPQNLPSPVPGMESPGEQQAAAVAVRTGDPDDIELISGDIADSLITAIRGCIEAPEGEEFSDADIEAVENIVIGWITGDPEIMRLADAGEDPYVAFAMDFFKKNQITKKERKQVKPVVIGGGFRLGGGEEREDAATGETTGTGLIGYAASFGVSLTQSESHAQIAAWRAKHSRVADAWGEIEKAVSGALKGRTAHAVKCSFRMSGKTLVIGLPSGRNLHYLRCSIEERETPWGSRRQICYWGVKSGAGWCEQTTHGGKLIENIVQAIARDLLADAIDRLNGDGIIPFLHVHDQILASSTCAKDVLKAVIKALTARSSWCSDLPIRASGFTSKRFIKS